MRRKSRIILSLLAVLLFALSSLSTVPVQAGARTLVIDSTTIGSDSSWNNVSGDVITEAKKIVFPNNSTESTAYISKAVIRGDKFFEEVESLECNLKFTQLPQGEKFVLAFGLGGIEAASGERDNVEVTFTNDNGIKVGVLTYVDYDTPEEVAAPVATGISIGSSATVKVQILTNQTIKVSINNKEVISAELPIAGEGRVGFIQTGNCGAEVSGLKILYYQYDRPENTNIEEDFEEDGINIAVLSGKTTTGTKTMSLEKLDDSQVLMFKGVDQTYLGTKYQYSNFEMTFDVPYLVLHATENENGDKVDGTGMVGISFGTGRVGQDKDGYGNALDAVVFKLDSVYSYKKASQYTGTNPYWQEEKPFSMKVSLIDNQVTVAGKWMEEENYTTLLTYSLGSGISTGCVHFWIMDQGNIAIDNLVIKNMDDTPGIIKKEFKSGKIERPADAVYVPFERVYAPGTVVPGSETGLGVIWYLLIPAAVVVGAAAITVTVVVLRKKAQKKEVVSHEN